MNKILIGLILCVALGCVSTACNNNKQASTTDNEVEIIVNLATNDGRFVEVDTLGDLVVYTPKFSSIDLACGVMPPKEHSSVIFCAAAAFTGSYLNEFKHNNVAGGHVTGGKYFSGYECEANTGCFVYNGDKTWQFVLGDTNDALQKAANTGGMGFSQIMIIHDGKVLQDYRVNPKNTKDVNEFRALCEFNGKLCVIDSKGFVNFIDFVKSMEQAGVKNAIYMDMGEGWNYSWWRHSDGTVVEIHETQHPYTTNWITFYK